MSARRQVQSVMAGEAGSSNLVQKEIKVTFCQYFVQHKAAAAWLT